MVETYKRKRSKSASKRVLRSTAQPIVIRQREQISTTTDVMDKTSEKTTFRVQRRMARQRKLSPETNEDNIDNDSEKEDSPVSDPVEENKDKKKLEKRNSRKGSFFVDLFFYLIIAAVIPLVLILNKMGEKGGQFRYPRLTDVKLEYFYNHRLIAYMALWLSVLGILAHVPIGRMNISLAREKHRCNGIFSLMVSTIILIALIYKKVISTNMIYDNYYSLIGSSITLAIISSFLMLLRSYFIKSNIPQHPENALHRFMMGWEINPRLCGLNLILFYDFRPGYTGWTLLNIIFCIKDWEDNGYKSINFSLLLSAICQIAYCIDALVFEGDLISKPFLVNGRFGFFHCFGNQVIVPFMFTLTTRTIQINKLQIPLEYLYCICVVNVLGYIIYRSSNIQKNNFRRNPYSLHLSHLKTLTNHHGSQLLVGGWWGFLRHPNYLGDIIMSLAWSAPAGLHFTVCWVYPIYFLSFIIIRCIQDDHKCSLEHESTWCEYRKCVPYQLIPFVF